MLQVVGMEISDKHPFNVRATQTEQVQCELEYSTNSTSARVVVKSFSVVVITEKGLQASSVNSHSFGSNKQLSQSQLKG